MSSASSATGGGGGGSGSSNSNSTGGRSSSGAGGGGTGDTSRQRAPVDDIKELPRKLVRILQAAFALVGAASILSGALRGANPYLLAHGLAWVAAMGLVELARRVRLRAVAAVEAVVFVLLGALAVRLLLGRWLKGVSAAGDIIIIGVLGLFLAVNMFLGALSALISAGYHCIHTVAIVALRDAAWACALRSRWQSAHGVGSVWYVGKDGAAVFMRDGHLPEPAAGAVRIVCISDTHLALREVVLPRGDILIHAGDVLFKDRGLAKVRPLSGATDGRAQLAQLDSMLAALPHSHKIVIGGNHDQIFEDLGPDGMRVALPSARYLEHETTTVSVRGRRLRIHGCPSTYLGSSPNRAFGCEFGGDEIARICAAIPANLDILVCHHTPSLSLFRRGATRSDDAIADAILTKNPRLVVSGHFHWAHGAYEFPRGDGRAPLSLINAAIMDNLYLPRNHPIVFDLD